MAMVPSHQPTNINEGVKYITLTMYGKTICRAKCPKGPMLVPDQWVISETRKAIIPPELPQFTIAIASEDEYQKSEWEKLMNHLQMYNQVAHAESDLCMFYIHPPRSEDHDIKSAIVSYSQKQIRSGLVQNYAHQDPHYLKTLGESHDAWIFGAIAELVDNSRDAKATTLKISVDITYQNLAGNEFPMLSVIDNGHGMTHDQLLKMVRTFGGKQHVANDPDRIGTFGLGLKTGSMRHGKDALILTQVANSRSIAFLSQTLNGGKENLEIPTVSYCRKGQFMEIDTNIQSETLAKQNLRALKEFSMFNKYLIGEKAGLFDKNGSGTQIHIWNLDKQGSSTYCLGWNPGLSGGSSFHASDIYNSSRRNRSGPSQMAQMLYYSLRSYLEVIFKDPRMKIFIQGSQVRSRPLAKLLNNIVVENGEIMEKRVQLTLGRSQLEWERGNCGMFLYWHGRLIELYKKVGGMVLNPNKSRGIIGVIDVTDLMIDKEGGVLVHRNKQAFKECDAYYLLEKWLGEKADEYLVKYPDIIQPEKGALLWKPDHEWVQCEKCREWRMLSPDFDCKTLPLEWFCDMNPFNGKCEIPEKDKVETEEDITSSSKRTKVGGGCRRSQELG